MILMQSPVRSLLASCLMGLLLMIPVTAMIFYKNIFIALQTKENSPKIILFLKADVDSQQTQQLQQTLQQHKEVDQVVVVSPLEGIKNLANQFGFGDLLEKFAGNSMPMVIQVVPGKSITSLEQLSLLADSFNNLPEVASVQFNKTAFKQQFAVLNFWRKLSTVTVFYSSLVALLAMIFIMQTFLLIHQLVKTNHPKLLNALLTNAILLSLIGMFLAIIGGSLLYRFFAPELPMLGNMLKAGIEGWMILKLGLAAILLGVCSGFLAYLLSVPSPEQPIRKVSSYS